MTADLLDTTRMTLLNEFFAAATHDASAAMSRWTQGAITLTLDEVRELRLDEIAPELGIGDDRLTMVVLSLAGELGGTMVLTFDDANGRQLAASLLNRDVNEGDEWSELEQSALNETGNILSCAYMNALTRLLETRLIPTPPYFLQDYGASVLQQALLHQASECDQVTVCRTVFRRGLEELNWNVIFVPSTELRRALMRLPAGA